MVTASVVALLLTFQTAEQSLSDDDRPWLDEDVRYIITDETREMFELSLSVNPNQEVCGFAWWNFRISRVTALLMLRVLIAGCSCVGSRVAGGHG